jgi:hypothetical protein
LQNTLLTGTPVLIVLTTGAPTEEHLCHFIFANHSAGTDSIFDTNTAAIFIISLSNVGISYHEQLDVLK